MPLGKLSIVGLLVGPSVLSASTGDAWKDWTQQSQARCPSHHVELICGDCYLSLVESFDATLTQAQRKRVQRIADIQSKCSDEQWGFYCEAARSFLAYKRLGLMPRFVRYGCQVVKCEEAASCSRLPPGP